MTEKRHGVDLQLSSAVEKHAAVPETQGENMNFSFAKRSCPTFRSLPRRKFRLPW